MTDIFTAFFGTYSPKLMNLINVYWILPAGLLMLYFYGRFHFNTPDYALSGTVLGTQEGSVRETPLSRLRGMAPPKFTTSRACYQRYMLFYVGILQVAFLILTCAPDIVRFSASLATNTNPLELGQMPENLQQRGVWSLFALTGLLSSFPGFKDLDGWLLSKLHKGASIPDGAEIYAQYLYDAKYKPDPVVQLEIVKTIRTHHFREVAALRENGSLENNWFFLRCMREMVKEYIFSTRNVYIIKVLRSDFEEIDQCISNLRERLFEHLLEQDRVLPHQVSDIDEFYDNLRQDSPLRQILLHRRQFDAEVNAIRLRLCRLTALALYAIENKPENMNTQLMKLGFDVDVVVVPRWHWEAVAKVGLVVLAVVLSSSAAYGVVANYFLEVPPVVMRAFVPVAPMSALIWAAMGAGLHTLAIIIALFVKRRFARRRIENKSHAAPENIAAAAACYIVIFPFQSLFSYVTSGLVAQAFLWVILPSITGYFVGKYIDKSRSGKPKSLLRSTKQALTMILVSIVISMVLLFPNFKIETVSSVAWGFTLYAAIVAGLIGLSVGEAFQRSYSHCNSVDDIARTYEATQGTNTKFVGDLILRSPSDSVLPNAELGVMGAGI